MVIIKQHSYNRTLQKKVDSLVWFLMNLHAGNIKIAPLCASQIIARFVIVPLHHRKQLKILIKLQDLSQDLYIQSSWISIILPTLDISNILPYFYRDHSICAQIFLILNQVSLRAVETLVGKCAIESLLCTFVFLLWVTMGMC